MHVIVRSWSDLLRLIEAEHRVILAGEEPKPSPNGEDDDGQEPGLEGGTSDGDGPSLE